MKKSSPSGSVKQKHFTPILDEQAIVETLSRPVNPTSTNEYLRTAAVLASVNAHDRQVLREAFVQMTTRAFSLNETLRILEMVMRFQVDLGNKKQTRALLLESMKTLAVQKLEEAERLRNLLLHDMRLTIQCAWEHDIIN